jgi:membrane fusion protein (multidrug efflux system)
MYRKWKWIAIGLAVIAVVIGGYFYLQHEKKYPSTSDAYVHADVVQIAPQVTAPVVAIKVHDYETVKKGQLLLQLDPKPFKIALDSAQAQLALTHQQIAAAKAAVTAAKAVVNQRKAQLADARQNFKRAQSLVKRGNMSKEAYDSAEATLKTDEAALAAARAQLEQARRELGSPGSNNARLKAAEAAVAQAQLDLSHTRIYAPAAGVIAKFTVRPGDVVEKDGILFALVENGIWWVDANYKETDLERIHPGQPAAVAVDIYPHHRFKGVVESISPASGASFSLLPPENATGNWVKVTQRFPVRVRITSVDPKYPLRIGASAEVTVNTTVPAGEIASGTAIR